MQQHGRPTPRRDSIHEPQTSLEGHAQWNKLYNAGESLSTAPPSFSRAPRESETDRHTEIQAQYDVLTLGKEGGGGGVVASTWRDGESAVMHLQREGTSSHLPAAPCVVLPLVPRTVAPAHDVHFESSAGKREVEEQERGEKGEGGETEIGEGGGGMQHAQESQHHVQSADRPPSQFCVHSMHTTSLTPPVDDVRSVTNQGEIGGRHMEENTEMPDERDTLMRGSSVDDEAVRPGTQGEEGGDTEMTENAHQDVYAHIHELKRASAHREELVHRLEHGDVTPESERAGDGEGDIEGDIEGCRDGGAEGGGNRPKVATDIELEGRAPGIIHGASSEEVMRALACRVVNGSALEEPVSIWWMQVIFCLTRSEIHFSQKLSSVIRLVGYSDVILGGLTLRIHSTSSGASSSASLAPAAITSPLPPPPTTQPQRRTCRSNSRHSYILRPCNTHVRWW